MEALVELQMSKTHKNRKNGANIKSHMRYFFAKVGLSDLILWEPFRIFVGPSTPNRQQCLTDCKWTWPNFLILPV